MDEPTACSTRSPRRLGAHCKSQRQRRTLVLATRQTSRAISLHGYRLRADGSPRAISSYLCPLSLLSAASASLIFAARFRSFRLDIRFGAAA
jgi:hypothetical protein